VDAAWAKSKVNSDGAGAVKKGGKTDADG
jgi:hypothetical protein